MENAERKLKQQAPFRLIGRGLVVIIVFHYQIITSSHYPILFLQPHFKNTGNALAQERISCFPSGNCR